MSATGCWLYSTASAGSATARCAGSCVAIAWTDCASLLPIHCWSPTCWPDVDSIRSSPQATPEQSSLPSPLARRPNSCSSVPMPFLQFFASFQASGLPSPPAFASFPDLFATWAIASLLVGVTASGDTSTRVRFPQPKSARGSCNAPPKCVNPARIVLSGPPAFRLNGTAAHFIRRKLSSCQTNPNPSP